MYFFYYRNILTKKEVETFTEMKNNGVTRGQQLKTEENILVNKDNNDRKVVDGGNRDNVDSI